MTWKGCILYQKILIQNKLSFSLADGVCWQAGFVLFSWQCFLQVLHRYHNLRYIIVLIPMYFKSLFHTFLCLWAHEKRQGPGNPSTMAISLCGQQKWWPTMALQPQRQLSSKQTNSSHILSQVNPLFTMASGVFVVQEHQETTLLTAWCQGHLGVWKKGAWRCRSVPVWSKTIWDNGDTSDGVDCIVLKDASGRDPSKNGVANGSAQNALWLFLHWQKMAYLATNGSWEAVEILLDS